MFDASADLRCMPDVMRYGKSAVAAKYRYLHWFCDVVRLQLFCVVL